MSSFLLVVTHSLFNAGLARLPSPEIYLSAFAVAKCLSQFLQSPVMMVRQTVTTLANDTESYYRVRKFMIILGVFVVLVFALFSLTGLAGWIFRNIMGIEGRILNESVTILKIFTLIPVAMVVRNFVQGIAIKFKKPSLITTATIIRIIFVSAVVIFIRKLSAIPGGIIAGSMLLSAGLIECIVVLLGVKMRIGNILHRFETIQKSSVDVNANRVTNGFILKFFWPLAVTALINTLIIPVINAGLARTGTPEIAISSYAVAWALGMIFMSPLMMFHQIPLNFVEENNDFNIKSVRRFAIYVGIVLSSCIAIMSFTSIGYYILRNLIGASEQISIMSVDVLKIMTILPLIRVAREFYWGILMKKNKTKYIGRGKIINLVTLILTIIIMTIINPSNPAVIGIIGMVSCEGTEFLYLYLGTQNIT